VDHFSVAGIRESIVDIVAKGRRHEELDVAEMGTEFGEQ
jgi:hypothetical protein